MKEIIKTIIENKLSKVKYLVTDSDGDLYTYGIADGAAGL